MEARRRQMRVGRHEYHEVEKDGNVGTPWAYNSALDSFVGAVLFGLVVNETRENAGILDASF